MSIQNSSNLISSIYKSRNIILNLLARQNYNTDDYAKFSINETNTMYQNNQLDISLEKTIEDADTKLKTKVYVHYYLGKGIRPSNIDEIIDDLFNIEQVLVKTDTLIIIVKDDINEPITNEIKHIWEKDGIFITMISIKRLQFNILDHLLVPPHRVMTSTEVEIVKKKYNISHLTEFPEISRFDPVSQVIGIRPGQICEITRSSKTAITSYYYRCCV
jgi:DNA-directed RNA polymerase subunit H